MPILGLGVQYPLKMSSRPFDILLSTPDLECEKKNARLILIF